MIEVIRQIIDAKGHLPVAARTIDPNANLYEAGLSPFAAIQVMLALEEAYGVEFPKQMLRRQSFSSLNSIAACLERVERKAGKGKQDATTNMFNVNLTDRNIRHDEKRLLAGESYRHCLFAMFAIAFAYVQIQPEYDRS